MRPRLRALKPDRQTFDNADTHWRGAQVWALNGATSTIRILRAHVSLLVSDQVVSTSLIPVDARTLGTPLCCKVDETFVITEILGSTFPWGDAPRGGDQAAAVARGEFRPGIIPRSITHESLEYEWTRAGG